MDSTLVGKDIEHFRIVGRISEGGMGIVCKAIDKHLEAVRAIKVLKPDLARDEEYMMRFKREAKNLAQLNHPNIVTVHTIFFDRVDPFIVMEYVEGWSLMDRIRTDGPLDAVDAVPIFKQILRGMDYAHNKGIIHRDIKPSNILLTPEGHVKIADFGLAKRQGGEDSTITVATIGTLHYMSPEQVLSMARVDHRSDLYSLGMTFYEALAGRTPFNEKDAAYIVLKAIAEGHFATPDVYQQTIPEGLNAIVMRSLAKDPQQRFQSAGEMLRALEEYERSAPHSARRRSTKTQPKMEPDPPPSRREARGRGRARPQPGRRNERKPKEKKPAASKPGKFPMMPVLVIGAVLVLAGVVWGIFALLDGTGSNDSPTPALPAVQEVTLAPGIFVGEGTPNDAFSMMQLRVLPFGDVTVEGLTYSYEAAQGAPLEVSVSPGERLVTCTHPLYGTRQAEIAIAQGERREVVCYFEPYIRVDAEDLSGNRLEAELYINNRRTGALTPLNEGYSLYPGEHLVEVFVEGYRVLNGTTRVFVAESDAEAVLQDRAVETLVFTLGATR